MGKWNKYAEALDKTDLYNYAKNGYDWCDIFYDWCLVQEFGVEVAKVMTNQPSKGCGAGCAFSASYYRAMNQWSSDPSLGAQIFFGSRGDEYHVKCIATHLEWNGQLRICRSCPFHSIDAIRYAVMDDVLRG